MSSYQSKRRNRSLAMQRAGKDMYRQSPVIPYLSHCEYHDKKLFKKQDAKRVCRESHEPGMRRYPCKHFEGWFHVGHLPDNVRKGYVSAEEVYGGSEGEE